MPAQVAESCRDQVNANTGRVNYAKRQEARPRLHMQHAFGDKRLAQVANDLDVVIELLAVKIKELSDTVWQQARVTIVDRSHRVPEGAPCDRGTMRPEQHTLTPERWPGSTEVTCGTRAGKANASPCTLGTATGDSHCTGGAR
jgi:hypothetical protein